ncbi:MAG: hypothetical protein IH811_04115 [Proteobacteria bacterium]|nr:hypothetical protein [Pseudomonadota bacterium]
MSKDETDYTNEFAAGLELMWGEGFLSPGGPEEVGLIVHGGNLKCSTVRLCKHIQSAIIKHFDKY